GGEISFWIRLLRQGETLRVREGGSSRVGEQTIEAANRVEHMEADRRGVRVHAPDALRRQAGKDALDLLAALEQTVGDRLKMRRHARDWSAQPDLGLGHLLALSLFLEQPLKQG